MINSDIKEKSKRDLCTACLRPKKTCFCGCVCTVQNHIQLIILQHPLEAHQAKNTARLLHLCLNNSQLYCGETFHKDFFEKINAPHFYEKEMPSKEVNRRNDNTHRQFYDLLLYPETPEQKSLGILSPPALDDAKLSANENTSDKMIPRLWVLDATWRKSRKMLYLNPELQQMPRVSLEHTPISLYTIRKAHSENQLSTLEASCYALQQLEHNRVDYSPVLSAFAAFIKQYEHFSQPF